MVAVVVLIAVYVTLWSPTRGGLELDVERSVSVGNQIGGVVPPEMRSLKSLYRTINLVQKRYIDATRIDSRAMFVSAMRAIQGQLAQILVREEGDQLVVRLDTLEKRFDLADVTTPWILLQRAKEVFSFLEAGLVDEKVEFDKIEYAAINGMLQTLDPHSIFLDPDQYRDMKDKTQGKFGGLGIVISIRDGMLTVISPVKGTPAHLAGLKAGDQILKIGEASTINMSLNDAVSLLRGEPGTPITVHILRHGWSEPKPFKIVRAIVKVESLESHMLENRVGYVQIKDFQSNTPKDLATQLTQFDHKGIQGLVLDLRGCPGGLLESAIRISDLFLKEGVIVTTAGQGPTERDVRRARDDGDEPEYPIVVLVNGGSASASEIVAGALKSHGRALLVGERTFGKGSVQVLYDFHDGAALKLTTAQYLTPGDVSIQSVGVTPQVELLPMRADEKVIDLQVERGYRESDLDHHFEQQKSESYNEKPDFILSYVLSLPQNMLRTGEEDVDGGLEDPLPDPDAPFEPDFEVKLAKDLISKMSRTSDSKVSTAHVIKLLEDKSERQERELVKALRKLDIDWSEGNSSSEPTISAKVHFTPEGSIVAGEEFKLTLEVTNQGKTPLYRVLALSESDFRPLDDRELAFGRIDPGTTVSRELKVKAPRDALDQTNDVLWSFRTSSEKKLEPIALRYHVQALKRPKFAYNYQFVDSPEGNGDSVFQVGETIKMVVDLRNSGPGDSLETYVTLKSLSGKKLFMKKGRAALKKLRNEEQKRAIFEFEIKPDFEESDVHLELGIADVDLRVYSVENLTIPISKTSYTVEPFNAIAKVAGSHVPVLSMPKPLERTVAELEEGSSVKVTGRHGGFYRVEIDEVLVGWIAEKAVVLEQGGNLVGAKLVLSSPPDLELEVFDQVVKTPTVRLRGRATDEEKVRDVYIFVGEDKVFFKPNTSSENPGELRFEAELPLEYGINYVAVVAEETAELDTREVLTIRRDREDGMAYLLSRSPTGKPKPLGVKPLELSRGALPVQPGTVAPARRGQAGRPPLARE